MSSVQGLKNCRLAGLPKADRVKFKFLIFIIKYANKTRDIKKIFGKKYHDNNEYCTVKNFRSKNEEE
jgi:hypothetical protein